MVAHTVILVVGSVCHEYYTLWKMSVLKPALHTSITSVKVEDELISEQLSPLHWKRAPWYCGVRESLVTDMYACRLDACSYCY